MSNPIFHIKSTVKWDTSGSYLTTIGNLLSQFTVSLVVWDNTGPITASSSVKERLRKAQEVGIRLWALCTKGGNSCLVEILVQFSFPIDTYRKYSDIPITFWETERSALYSQLSTTWSYGVVEGYVV